MKRYWVKTLLVVSLLGTWAQAEKLPIRIDASRNGEVYVQDVERSDGFKLLSERTPASYQAEAGQRIDVKVVSSDGFFHRWHGTRQNITGPSNITIRMERGLAWDRVALVGAGASFLALALLFGWRRRAKVESEVARSQITQLTQRVQSAEKVGSLARTLGDYLVLDKLGAGAMGVVYKVKNAAGDIFAAKVPNQMDERVLREAEVSASLNSPHIVECFGLVEGEPNFLLMEFMDGSTVHDWLAENQRLPLDRIDHLVSQLLEAIEAAHSKGVYHRDIKPENLFLARENGREILKVMDFGLASSVNAARLTRTGEAMGTPIYASPEQLSGNPVDSTTDLYSVGVFVYELATGLLPWSQSDPVALTMAKYKALPKEPIESRPDLPMAWNQVVVDLLQGDPQKRPRSIEELKRRWAEGRKLL